MHYGCLREPIHDYYINYCSAYESLVISDRLQSASVDLKLFNLIMLSMDNQFSQIHLGCQLKALYLMNWDHSLTSNSQALLRSLFHEFIRDIV